MKNILLTGSDGFIGSHLLEHLVSSGYNVKAFTLYNSFSNLGWIEQVPKNIKNEVEIFSGDIRDAYGVRAAMKGCDAVLNLAALIAIPYSYHSPGTYVDTNIKGTLNILQAARDLGIKKVIHTSTSEVYGTARFVPITEEHPLQGQSPYSATKIGADQLALSFYKSFETPVMIVRPFNTFGPRQSARAVLPTIITQLLNGNKKLKLGALTPTRDFNYVKDIVRGFESAIRVDAFGETVNLATQNEITIGDAANTIAEVIGVQCEFEQDAVRMRPTNSEVERLLGSNEKAKKILGWSPEYTGLSGFKKAISETVEWFRIPANLNQYKSEQYNI